MAGSLRSVTINHGPVISTLSRSTKEISNESRRSVIELSKIEQKGLEKIVRKPIAHYKHFFKWQIYFTIACFILIVTGLAWIRTYRSPTVTQTMVFCALIQLSSSIGCALFCYINYRQIGIIKHLHKDLEIIRGEVSANSQQLDDKPHSLHH
ncbi:hypothetical protein OAG71_04085 [bacterium]|nr:hypothetical protein [bacterium]